MSGRELGDVIADMLGMIPDGESGLRAGLESVRDSSHYCPPEGMSLYWKKALSVLVAEIGEPEPGWQTDVARCFRGTP